MGLYEQHYVRNYLAHSGRKGMKWGRRLYQNEDGTLTELGKKRYARDAKEKEYKDYDEDTQTYYKMVGKKNEKERQDLNVDANRYVTEDISRTKKITEETSQMTNKLKSVTDASIRSTKSNRLKLDLSNMSDKQMRDEINRALLERQYNDMFAPQKSTRGREIAAKTLEVVGSVVGITGSALGIALAIRDLTGNG